jgi:hypothetical protein
MTIETIEQNFREKVCQKLRLSSEGVSRYRLRLFFSIMKGLMVQDIPWDFLEKPAI